MKANFPEHYPGGIARILIVDDHEIVRDAVSLLLNKLERPVITLAAGDFQTARNILSNETVDLVLLGISSPIGPSLNGVVFLRRLPACPPIAVFSTHTTRRFVSSAVAVGVSGFIPKSRSAVDILQAVTSLLGGNKYMPTEDEMTHVAGTSDIEASEHTYAEENLAAAYDLAPREAAVLKCVCQGMPNKRISTELNISPNTVRNYLSRIFKVMNVRNRTEAVARTQNILR
ncbi:response regulator transcription factor [Rhizobacter sp. Root16D2]|uniref:response regulator transcription factor n=1 Tax=Rhizobacter sp. Root16D2 TaxID=1736479 RepID=UPI0009EA7805|nr:response regulator transcription factor [Rhizobacter sp. Root16D2]